MANSVYLDEVAHFEPPHQDPHCLQIQLFSSLVVKELMHQQSANHIMNIDFSANHIMNIDFSANHIMNIDFSANHIMNIDFFGREW